MLRTLFFNYILTLYLFTPTVVFGQNKFKDLHKVLWIKSIGVSIDQKEGLNFNIPIQFSDDFPMLNKKYDSSIHSSVFYVLKSNKGAEKIFSLYNFGELHTFYTDKISSSLEHSLNTIFLEQGMIVNFNFYNTKFKKNKKHGIFYLDNGFHKSDLELYEILVCSNCDEEVLKNKIETYLAIKYGVTLNQKNKYIGSDNRKIWDEKYNKSFNNHIIGIARDDYFGLEQKASFSNVENDFILRRATSEQNLFDKTYVLLGDNNGEKKFDNHTGMYKRKWLIQNKGDYDENIDFDINIRPKKGVNYFLHTSEGLKLENDIEDTLKLSFKNLEIKNNLNYYLTLKQKRKIDFNIFENFQGINKNYILGINDVGIPPFYITATDLNSNEKYFFVSNESEYNLVDLPTSDYDFTVKDVEGKEAELKNTHLDFKKSKLISLAKNWQLTGRKTLEIRPLLEGNEDLEYRWYLQDKLVSKKSKLYVNYTGEFVLEVLDKRGNKERFPFSVNSKKNNEKKLESQWIVYPNPVNAGDEFTVTYFFEHPQKVDFYIYTLEGKFIFRDQLGVIDGGTYNYTLQGNTTYLLVPIINSKVTMKKLIVK